MRGVLLSGLCGMICLAGVARESSGRPPQSAANASRTPADAAYEADEVAMLRSVAGQAQRLAGGRPACIDLHLIGQWPNAATLAERAARSARQARSPGFHRIERALARHGGRAATADRDLDPREVAGVEWAGGAALVERCPAAEWFTFARAVQSGDAALFQVWARSDCSSRTLFIALRKHGRAWRVEGEYSEAVPDGMGCGIAYPGSESPAGRYMLVGG